MKAKPREDRQEAIGPNDIWAMDFVHDQLATGKKLRILTIVDIPSRFSPATGYNVPIALHNPGGAAGPPS